MRQTILSLCLLSLLFITPNRSFALKPSHIYTIVPDTLGLPYHKQTITSSDGVHLNSWTFLPKGSDRKTTLVIACADAGNMSGYVNFAALLAQNGYTVTLFDYRGFGTSDNFPINNDYLYYNEFIKDLSAAVAYNKKIYPHNKTGIWCFSMGSIITTLLPHKDLPDFIIGDSYITNLQQTVKTIETKKNKKIFLPQGSNVYQKKLQEINIPMLLFAGTTDDVATAEGAKQLSNTHKNITLITYNGGHMQGFMKLSKSYLGSEYIADIIDFTQKLK